MGEAFLLGRRSGKVFVGLIEVPVLSGQPVYTGAAITPTWTNYDPEKMTIGGAYSGTNAGTYYATFTPKQGYYWSEGDGDDNVRVIPWTINKAAGSLSLSATSVTLNSDTTTTTVTVTRAGDGAISVVSNDTSVATVSVSGTTLTISSVNDTTGEAVITVSVAEGANYAAPANKAIAVSAQFLPVVGTALDDCNWDDISRIAEAGLASSYFEVGDRKGVTVSGMVGTQFVSDYYYVYIIGFDHNRAINTIDFGTFKSASNGRDMCLVDSEYDYDNTSGTKYFNMNHWGRYSDGGWKGCDMRYDVLGSTDVEPSDYGAAVSSGRTGYDATTTCATSPVDDTLMAALPPELREVMKPMTIYSDNVSGGDYMASDVTASVDYLPLLAEYEIFGSRDLANEAEQNYQAQYAYFAAGNSRVKYPSDYHDTGSVWWGRSASSGGIDEGGFCSVYDDGSAWADWADRSFGLAPIFRV